MRICNKGDFFHRVEENVKLGWEYPKDVYVTTARPGGKSGAIHELYFFDGETFEYLGDVPTWATPNGKYQDLYEKEKSAHPIQMFVTMRKGKGGEMGGEKVRL